MDSYERFKDYIKVAVKRFREFDPTAPIRVVSNYDADGISACAVLVKALNNEGRKYSVSIVNQLTNDIIKELSREDYKYYIFADMGSGQLALLNEKLAGKQMIILDHHEIPDVTYGDNIFLVNPHIFDIDGGKEISAAGVSYLFAKALNPKNVVMAHIGVIGAIGDVQEQKEGFPRLVNEILEDAKRAGLLDVRKGMRFYGSQTRPLHKLLEMTSDPYIPDVSGSESKAIQFLHDIGIEPKMGGSFKKMNDLSDEETKRLATAIILKRSSSEENPEDIFGYNYILLNEKEDSPLRDAREFATLLNACGRLNKASLGIGCCLGDDQIKRKAIAHLADYKRALMSAMNWIRDNKENGNVIEGDKFVIINAGDKIQPSIVGTVISIMAKAGDYEDGTVLLSLGQNIDGTTKVSIRVAGMKPQQNIDVRSIVSKLAEHVGGEFGGHQQAAGALIPTDKEKEFIEKAIELLSDRNNLLA